MFFYAISSNIRLMNATEENGKTLFFNLIKDSLLGLTFGWISNSNNFFPSSFNTTPRLVLINREPPRASSRFLICLVTASWLRYI